MQSNETLASGLVHRGAGDFAVQCTSLNRCAAVYAGGLHVTVWRAAGRCQLAAMVAAPQTYYGRTVGLMGLWSSDRSDDFLMSDSLLLTSPDLNAPSEEELHLFGLSCEWKPPWWSPSLLLRGWQGCFPGEDSRKCERSVTY